MADTITSKEYNGTGSQNTFAYAFQSYQKEDVKVTVGGNVQTQGTHYQIDSYTVAGGTINFSVGGNAATYYNGSSTVTASPPAGTGNIRVYRETDITAGSVGEYEPKATYVAGSSIKAADLNNNAKQALYASFELRDQEIQETKIRDGAVTSAKIKDDTIVNADVNSAAAIAGTKISPNFGSQAVVTTGTLAAGATTVTGNIAVSGTVDGRDVAADGTKLDGIEAGATADQTNAEIRAAVEAASDSNVFTDADHTKLNGIETNATADQTNAEIRTAVEAASDSNVFTDADHTKLNGIAASANNYSISSDLLDEDDFATDSATKVPSQQSTKAYIGTYAQPKDAELTTLAGMQSGTASILASGTALTSTTAELNLLDGKSIVTTISSPTDVQLPTAQAVEERIVDLVTDVGGFRPIANETSFPATNPDPGDNAGTIVSIKALASNLTSNGSGVATIANGAGSGNTVTINGMANSDTIEAGKGILVETTSTLHTYTFHRETLAPADITTANTAVSDFNNRYRILASGTDISTVGSLDDGDLLWDSNSNTMKVYDASASQWSEVTSVGDFKLLTVVPAGATSGTPDYANNATFDLRDGSNAASVTSVGQLLISVNGVLQKPNTGTSAPSEGFALVDSNTIIFGSNPGANASVFVTQIGSAVSVNVPATNSIVEAAIQTNVVSEEKLKIHQNPSDGKFLKYTTANGMEWGDVPAGVGDATGVDFNDDVEARWGTGDDLIIKHTSNESYIHSKTGDLNINVWDSTAGAWDEAIVVKADSAGVDIKHNAATKLATSATGVTVTGTVAATAYTGDGSSLTGVAATSANGAMYKNTLNITDAHTIAATEGAHSVGPISVGNTVTVSGRWVIS